jgi:hypothetical protein
MPQTWLTVIAWIWLGFGFISSGLILFDIFVRGYRQRMAVMDAVYPITALYLGPLALWFYWRWGRNAARLATEHGRASGAAGITTRSTPPVHTAPATRPTPRQRRSPDGSRSRSR